MSDVVFWQTMGLITFAALLVVSFGLFREMNRSKKQRKNPDQ